MDIQIRQYIDNNPQYNHWEFALHNYRYVVTYADNLWMLYEEGKNPDDGHPPILVGTKDAVLAKLVALLSAKK